MRCWICNQAEATESHHVYPIHLGGPVDGVQISICGNCHSFVHQAGAKMYAGTPLEGNLKAWYDRFARARKATALIVTAMIDSESADLSDSLVPITFKIPRKLRDRLHIRKQDRGATNLNTYIIGLIIKDLGGNVDTLESVMNVIKKG